MRVLITGGCGFIGSHVAERFSKEGYQVCIIDNLSTGTKENVGVPHKFFQLNVADKRCEDVFRTNNPDIVVHLAAQVDVGLSERDPYLDSESNILGLVNMLNLSSRYKVKRFIFASSAAVYGDAANLPIVETSPIHPMSVYGINKANGETYCRQWKDLYGLNTTILRFANVYGPRQGLKGETGVISIFLKQIMENKDLVVYGDGTQTRDYVYVTDVADAIYRSASQTYNRDTINISTNTECSLESLLQILSHIGEIKSIRHEAKRQGDIYKSRLDNTKATQNLGWKPKFSLQEGLGNTYQWYQQQWSGAQVAATMAVTQPASINQFWGAVRPYFENLMLFALMVVLNFSGSYGGSVNSSIGLDYNYLYIATMGLFYGKKQSIPATVLAAGLLCYNFLFHGADLVAILYQAQHILHFAAYLFTGVVTGYVCDSKERIVSDLTVTLQNLQERYKFLENMYLDCVGLKDKLYAQIVNSDNTIGKTYSIIKELDTLAVENVFTAAGAIIAKTMNTDSMAIYTVGKKRDYLRQKTKMGASLKQLPNSLKIQDYEYLQKMMEDKKVYTNKQLKTENPNMAAPIIYGGQVIGVIQIFNLPFESLTLYYENLLKITSLLISDALGRAYLYEEGIHDKKYVETTRILIAEEFEKIRAEFENRRNSYDTDLRIVLLKIISKGMDYKTVYQCLAGVIRDEDFIGLRQDGEVYALLPHISSEMALKVQERIKTVGLNSIEVQDEQHD